MELFPKYVAKLYAIQFSDYAGQTFAVKGSKPGSDGSTIVNAEIDQPNGEPIKLDFIVQSAGQAPKVIDVKVEGVSLLVTKRSEFDWSSPRKASTDCSRPCARRWARTWASPDAQRRLGAPLTPRFTPTTKARDAPNAPDRGALCPQFIRLVSSPLRDLLGARVVGRWRAWSFESQPFFALPRLS